MKKLNLLLLLLFFAGSLVQAQLQMPQPSPSAFVSQQVGFTKISIDYSSPGVKGREVFGELLPFGTTWRAGANAATTIEFTTPVVINGTDVSPGKYSIFITPMENDNWVFHINSKGNTVYNYMKDGGVDEAALKADDLVSIEAEPMATPDLPAERLTYLISANDNNTATISMHWDTTMVSFDVDTNADEMLNRMQTVLK